MDCVQISDKFKDCLLLSAIAFTADLCFSYLHINCAPKAVNIFTAGIFVFNFFLPRSEKSKTVRLLQKTFCKSYRHRKHLITADHF